MGVFNKTIIPLALVEYEMIIANSALRASLAIFISYPTRPRGIIVKYPTQPHSLMANYQTRFYYISLVRRM